MKVKRIKTWVTAVAVASGLLSLSAAAMADEQFVPLLTYRTGSFAPLGIPWADCKMDYLKLVNAQIGRAHV